MHYQGWRHIIIGLCKLFLVWQCDYYTAACNLSEQQTIKLDIIMHARSKIWPPIHYISDTRYHRQISISCPIYVSCCEDIWGKRESQVHIENMRTIGWLIRHYIRIHLYMWPIIKYLTYPAIRFVFSIKITIIRHIMLTHSPKLILTEFNHIPLNSVSSSTKRNRFRFMVFNSTFNNNLIISWRSVLLVE